MAEQWLADVAAELYALPFDDFVAARTAAAKDAAAVEGQRTRAADVRSLPKPSVAAWTVNMLASRRPEILRELAGLGLSMRAAQSSLDAPELRRLGVERRQLLGSAVKEAKAAAAEQGRKISAAIAAEVEGTLRAATADEGAAAAVQSGCLLRSLSADGVDVVDLSGAVALPGLALPAAAPPVPAPVPAAQFSPGRANRTGGGAKDASDTRTGGGAKDAASGTRTGGSPKAASDTRTGALPRKVPEQPRLRAVRQEPRKSAPTALIRARAALKEAEEAAREAADEALRHEEDVAATTALTLELSETVQSLREELVEREQELKAARKRRELSTAHAQQSARAATRARRTEDLARERVLRLGNTPD
jgi:hypothetical protein